MVCTSLEAYWWDLSISAKKCFVRFNPSPRGVKNGSKITLLNHVILKWLFWGQKIQCGWEVKHFGRISIRTFSFSWIFISITHFVPQQGVQMLKNDLFHSKKPPNFFAVTSHPMMVISNFLEALKIIKYTVSGLEHFWELKYLFVDRRAPERRKKGCFGAFSCEKCIFTPPEPPKMGFMFVFCGFTSQDQHNRPFKKFWSL